ncbi:hypothetical protein MHLP_01515 [Candidatus Mycoplasma haematolamae str. Purdue]|uniref:Uncharacterized protein n=1 Tax=Mycoplasma haematolamae (strain Purdue) TaxID=1212765 RepID=I7BJ68_MYCHA|nr:hypothetical protein [Candidatus Mycoplasma haematolamae]AFO51883.1 hypothetical protein MHLP_01515 [Candidatus Mycoplasma haematolamae str. Purdue]
MIVGAPFKIALAVFSAGGVVGAVSYATVETSSAVEDELPTNDIEKGKTVNYRIKVKTTGRGLKSASLSCDSKTNHHATIKLDPLEGKEKVKVSCTHSSNEPAREVQVMLDKEKLVCSRQSDEENLKVFQCSILNKALDFDLSEIVNKQLILTW